MNAPEPFPDDQALDDEAAAWLCEREEGFTARRARAFAAWRDSDLRHAAAISRVERTLSLLKEMPAVRAPLEARVGVAAGWRTVKPRSGLRVWGWSLGLAAALVLGLMAWRTTSLRAPAGERYATDGTLQRSIALSDGSVVDINTGSEVSVQFTARERRVTLGSGEGYFKVSPDTSRPFIVTAGGVSVHAVGTEFNVHLAAHSVDVLVLEGAVQVGREKFRSLREFDSPPSLGAGELASVSRSGTNEAAMISKVDGAAIRARLAWQDRSTSFTDVPLREVVARFNRLNTVQLVLADETLGARKIGGVIAMNQVAAFARLLEQDGDIVVEWKGASQIVLRRVK